MKISLKLKLFLLNHQPKTYRDGIYIALSIIGILGGVTLSISGTLGALKRGIFHNLRLGENIAIIGGGIGCGIITLTFLQLERRKNQKREEYRALLGQSVENMVFDNHLSRLSNAGYRELIDAEECLGYWDKPSTEEE